MKLTSSTLAERFITKYRLRFVPLLPRTEYEKLKVTREQAAARFGKGASGKEVYLQWQIQYEKSQVPVFFTKDYSIFVDRWADLVSAMAIVLNPGL